MLWEQGEESVALSASRPDRTRITAAVVTVVVLVVSGVAYRVLAGRLARATHSVPLPPGTLARLPMRLGDWIGQDVRISEAVAEATDSDDLLHRSYVRRGEGQSVSLFVAYGVRARDLVPHRPEVCYPSSGWTLRDSSPAELPLPDGSTLACRIYEFAGGSLSANLVKVLNYYIVDGRYAADVSLLRSKAWRGSGGVNYVVQVQVSCDAGPPWSSQTALALTQAFAVESVPAIRALLLDATASSRPATVPAESDSRGPVP